MKKKIFIFVVLLLLGGTSVLHAQENNSSAVGNNSTKKPASVENTHTVKTAANKVKKPKEQLTVEDSLEILNNRIKVLCDSVQRLNKSIEYLKTKPTTPSSNGNNNQYVGSLQKQIIDLRTALNNQVVETFKQYLITDANDFYCRAVMESPLYYKYDQNRINQSINMAKVMGYDKKNHKLNWIYNLYYPFLEHYGEYNQELIAKLDRIILQFESGVINRMEESREFEEWLKNDFKYYEKREKGVDNNNSYRHIFFLDYQIERLRKFFKSDTEFKKENFQKVRKALSI